MNAAYLLASAVGIGIVAGLRSLTAPAATAWAVRLGWLRPEGPLSLIGSVPSVVVLTLLAVVGLVTDKLPKTPNRTSPPGLIARTVTGAVTGACIAASEAQGALLGALLGAVGGVVGCFGGYQARTRLVKRWVRRTSRSPSLKIWLPSPAPCGSFRDSNVARAFMSAAFFGEYAV